MNTPKEVKTFPRYSISNLADRLSRSGKCVIDSEFDGTVYMIEKSTIGILSGKNGMLSMDIANVEDFANELLQIAELARDRKRMQIKGA